MSTHKRLEGRDFVRCRICGREFRSLTTHLSRCHGISSDEYKNKYGVDFVSCTAHRQSLSKRSKRNTGYEVLSRDQVKEKLRKLSETVSPITSSWLNRNGYGYLLQYAVRLFGGLPQALAKLDLEVSVREEWSQERIIAEIRQLHREGKNLNRRQVALEKPRLVGATVTHFGTWVKALAAAGMDPADYHRALPKSTAEWEKEFRDWVDCHGPLSYTKLRATGSGNLHDVALRRYGSLEEAARSMGLPFKTRQALSRSAVAARLKARLLKGEKINVGVLRKEEPKLLHAMKKHFGSHRECLVELGYDPDRVGKAAFRWTKARVDRELLAFASRNGEVAASAVREERPRLARNARKFYGSIEAATAALGLRCVDSA